MLLLKPYCMAVHSYRYSGFPEGESVKCESFSLVLLFATPGTVAYQAPLSKGFSKQEYWSGLHFPPTGDLPDPGIGRWSPALQVDSLPSEPSGKPSLKVSASEFKICDC